MVEEFLGYARPDGKVGIRNKIVVIPSVMCVNRISQQIASKLKGAVALTHPLGCGQFGLDYSYTVRTLSGLGSNPNVYGVIVVGLGCENISDELLAKNISKSNRIVDS